jgi:hypothetical protein
MNLAAADYKTEARFLESCTIQIKKHNILLQTIEIILRDLSKYDELMEGLVDEGLIK